MSTNLSKVKKGMIKLPSSLNKSWSGESVFVFGDNKSDTILVKKAQSSSLLKLKKPLKAIGNKLSNKEIKAEIRAARKKR